jgi:hypothetical protein
MKSQGRYIDTIAESGIALLQGAGLDILEKVLGTLQPTHLVQMQSNTSSRNLPDDTSWLSSSAPSLQTHLVLPAVDCSLDGKSSARQTLFIYLDNSYFGLQMFLNTFSSSCMGTAYKAL